MVEAISIGQPEIAHEEDMRFIADHRKFGKPLNNEPENSEDLVDIQQYSKENAEIRAGQIIGALRKADPEQKAHLMQKLNREIVEILARVDPRRSLLKSKEIRKASNAKIALQTLRIYYETILELTNKGLGESYSGSHAYESAVAEYIAMDSVSEAFKSYGNVYYSTNDEDVYDGIDFWFVSDDGKRIGFQTKCSRNTNPPEQVAMILKTNPKEAANQITESPYLSGYSMLRTSSSKSELSANISKQTKSCARLNARAAVIMLPREESTTPNFFDKDNCLPTGKMMDSLYTSSVFSYIQS